MNLVMVIVEIPYSFQNRNGPDGRKEEKRIVESIRKAFKRYICAQEAGGRQAELTRSAEAQETAKRIPQQKLFFPKRREVTTTGALLPGNDDPVTGGQKLVCYYCQQDHWSDECNAFPTPQSRKKKKIKGNCFISLSQIIYRKIAK